MTCIKTDGAIVKTDENLTKRNLALFKPPLDQFEIGTYDISIK